MVRAELNRLLVGWSAYFSYGARWQAYRASTTASMIAFENFSRDKHRRFDDRARMSNQHKSSAAFDRAIQRPESAEARLGSVGQGLKGGHGWLTGLCGLAEVGFLELPEIVHVEVAVGLQPIFVGLDG